MADKLVAVNDVNNGSFWGLGVTLVGGVGHFCGLLWGCQICLPEIGTLPLGMEETQGYVTHSLEIARRLLVMGSQGTGETGDNLMKLGLCYNLGGCLLLLRRLGGSHL